LTYCDGDEEPMGCFTHAEPAVRMGRERGCTFSVSKYRFVDVPTLPVRHKIVWNPYLFDDKLQEDSKMLELPERTLGSCWAGCADYNGRGELCHISIDKALPASEEKYTELLYSAQRFENMYVELPNPFQLGDIVQMVGDHADGRRGVVETSQEEWARFHDRVRDGLYADHSDASVTVEFPAKNGFSHEHISPLYLERCQPGKDEPDHDILEAGSLMLRGQCGLDYFTSICREYCEEKRTAEAAE